MSHEAFGRAVQHGLPVESVAHTIVLATYEGMDGHEAFDGQFDGTYHLYCVCLPETNLDAISTADPALYKVLHRDESCIVIDKHVI